MTKIEIILIFIQSKKCVTTNELLEFAIKNNISRAYLNNILSHLARSNYIIRSWTTVNGKKQRKYCINPEKQIPFS